MKKEIRCTRGRNVRRIVKPGQQDTSVTRRSKVSAVRHECLFPAGRSADQAVLLVAARAYDLKT